MVGSCGADASVVACWIRTLTSVLIVSLDGIVSSTGAFSWSYGLWWFKEVRNGMRGFVCVISVRGLFCNKMGIFQPISQLRNSRWCFAWSSSNGHNFFVSTPNRAPFEALDSWLPKLQKRYSMYNLSSRKSFKNVSNSSEMHISVLILIIQKSTLHQNKLELKHWNQN